MLGILVKIACQKRNFEKKRSQRHILFSCRCFPAFSQSLYRVYMDVYIFIISHANVKQTEDYASASINKYMKMRKESQYYIFSVAQNL